VYAHGSAAAGAWPIEASCFVHACIDARFSTMLDGTIALFFSPNDRVGCVYVYRCRLPYKMSHRSKTIFVHDDDSYMIMAFETCVCELCMDYYHGTPRAVLCVCLCGPVCDCVSSAAGRWYSTPARGGTPLRLHRLGRHLRTGR
jgi:hypothetical protein